MYYYYISNDSWLLCSLDIKKERNYAKRQVENGRLVENNNILELRKNFNALSKKLKFAIAEFENDNMNNLIKNVGPHPVSSRPFWNKINNFRKPKNPSFGGSIKSGNVILDKPKDKANLFGSILKETYSAEQSFPYFNNLFFNKVNIESELITNGTENDSSWEGEVFQSYAHVTTSDIEWFIKRLKNSKSVGYDGISNHMLKNLSPSFMFILRNLINISYTTASLPKDWKNTKIIMIPKKQDGDLKDPSNYRPLSLTSSIAKLAERIVADKLLNYFNKKNSIVPHQSGFRIGRGTHDNLMFLTQKIELALGLNQRICAVYFDISKAFDRVWHNGLLKKLHDLGTCSTIKKLISAFLNGRYGSVFMDGALSETFNIETGVPQGSVLGPLLFSVFINDIPHCNLSDNTFSLLFADDLLSCFRFSGLGKNEGIEQTINLYLRKLEHWLNLWRLKMASDKCCYTFFSKSANLSSRFDLKLYGVNLPYSKENRFLGVIFDESLSFKSNTELIIKKCTSRLNIIKILSHRSWHLAHKTLISLYSCLIRSVFDYTFFNINSLAEGTLKKLQVMQNCALRSIFKNWERGGVTEILHAQANLPKVEERMLVLGSQYLKNVKYDKTH